MNETAIDLCHAVAEFLSANVKQEDLDFCAFNNANGGELILSVHFGASSCIAISAVAANGERACLGVMPCRPMDTFPSSVN